MAIGTNRWGPGPVGGGFQDPAHWADLLRRGHQISPDRMRVVQAAGYGPTGEPVGAGGGSYPEQVAGLHEQRLSQVMGRLPSQELTQMADPLLQGELSAGPWAGTTPEQLAYQTYAPQIESQAVQGLTRRGIQGGAAAGATVGRALTDFAAPLAIEEARGTERRRSEHVQRLMQAMELGIGGARTAAGTPGWPDWQRAVEFSAQPRGGTSGYAGITRTRYGGDRQSPFGAQNLLRAAGREPRTNYTRPMFTGTYSPSTGTRTPTTGYSPGSYYSPAETSYRQPTYA